MHKARWQQKCAICRELIGKQEPYRRSDVGNVHERCGLARPSSGARRAAYAKRKAQARRRAKVSGRG